MCHILECLDVMEYHWKVHVNNDVLSAALYFTQHWMALFHLPVCRNGLPNGDLNTSNNTNCLKPQPSSKYNPTFNSGSLSFINKQVHSHPVTKNVHDYNNQTPHVTFGCFLLLTMWSLCILLLHYYPFVLRRPQ